MSVATRLLLAVADVAVLAYILVVALWPRKPWRLVYALGWLWLIAATPAPSPQPTLPIAWILSAPASTRASTSAW